MGGVSPNDKETNLVTNEDCVTAELTYGQVHDMIVGLSEAAKVMDPDTPVYMTFGSAGDFNITGRFSVDGNYD